MNPEVLVVGAAGAIGTAVCTAFTEAGMSVLGWDRNRPQETGHAWLNETVDLGHDDGITLPPSIRHIVNCSGGPEPEEAREPGIPGLDTFRRALDSNVITAYECARLLYNSECHEDRSLTLISSVNAQGIFGMPAYSAAKGSVQALARALRPSLLSKGVRTHCLVLGTVRSTSWERLWSIGSGLPVQEVEYPETPTGRILEPRDVAHMSLFLSRNSFATGTDVTLDNGQGQS